MFWILFVIAQVGPDSLAPGPRQLHDALARCERLLLDVETLERAVARVHNRLGEQMFAPGGIDCKNTQDASLAPRARILLRAHRDTLQSAITASKHLARTAAAPTIEGVLDEAKSRQVQDALAQTQRAHDRYLEMVAWQRRFATDTCHIALDASIPGLEGYQGSDASVAVIVIGDGMLCPQRIRPVQQVAIVKGSVCYETKGQCECVAKPVAAAAVLGP